MAPFLAQGNGTVDDGYCAVVELSGMYKVVPHADVKDGHSTAGRVAGIIGVDARYVEPVYVQPGPFYDKPHLLVKGREGVKTSVLQQAVETVVDGLNAQVASHKGWVLPKFETLETKIKDLAPVAWVSNSKDR